MRGQGAAAKPALLRVDGAGKIDDGRARQASSSRRSTLPNAPAAAATGAATRAPPRSPTWRSSMAGSTSRASRTRSSRRSCARCRIRSRPSTAARASRSIHGNHGQFETRSPVYTFVPYKVNGETNLIAGYLCTPLVKFPVDSLKPGAKIMGTTIAELGNRNRPLDMVALQEGRQGVPADVEQQPRRDEDSDRRLRERREDHRAASPPRRAASAYETITAMKGIEQLDLLDDARTIVLARIRGRRPQPRRRRTSVERVRRVRQVRGAVHRCHSLVTLDSSRMPSAALCLGAAALVVCLGAVGAAACRCAEIRLQAATGHAPAAIEVLGLRSDAARRASFARALTAKWAGVLRVSVAEDQPAMLGEYAVTSDGIRFTPSFPLDPGPRVCRELRGGRDSRRRSGRPRPRGDSRQPSSRQARADDGRGADLSAAPMSCLRISCGSTCISRRRWA